MNLKTIGTSNVVDEMIDGYVKLITKTQMIDITEMVSKISWSGDKETAPRSLNVTVAHTKGDGLHDTIPNVTDLHGYGIMFLDSDLDELYRGAIFDANIVHETITIKSYDNLIGLTKNREEYVFVSKRADEIAIRVFTDFGVQFDEIANTGYVIPYVVFDGDKLYDIIREVLFITYKNTGVKYFLTTVKGKARIIRKVDNNKQLVIEQKVNLVGYDYSSTIDDIATKIKLIAGRDKKTIVSVASDEKAISNYGTMQYLERVSGEINKSQLDAMAKQMLNNSSFPTVKLKLNNILGDKRATTGSLVYVIIEELKVAKPFYIEKDSHNIQGKFHSMNLELIETWDMPEIGVGETVKKEPKTSTKKDSKNKRKGD